jgi:hypothetical protein
VYGSEGMVEGWAAILCFCALDCFCFILIAAMLMGFLLTDDGMSCGGISERFIIKVHKT